MGTGRAASWHPESWREREAFGQPQYADPGRAEQVLRHIARKPPLVFPGEVDALGRQLAEAAAGGRFLLQGGDCVERFADCNEHTITNKLKIMLQMSVILTHASRQPVVRVGRIAGQYCKPRSHDTERIDGREVLTYRGDAINGVEPDARQPDPERLLEGYYHSAVTSNYARALVGGGFADLHNPYNWNLYAIEKTPKWPEYREIVEQILDAIRFMESFGGANPEQLGRVELFTSHEGLHLGYEAALTRRFEGRFYNLGAHMLWIGDRSRALSGAHVEYFRGVCNPLGIKVGPGVDVAELVEVIRTLNPSAQAGKIVVITRLGLDRVSDLLPGVIEGIEGAGLGVVWSCDPMHGNTRVSEPIGVKTRSFDDILGETERSFEIHARLGTRLAGIHFELTGEEVTECTGGAVELTDEDLRKNYRSHCDPRLNYAQSLEMAFLVSRMLKSTKA